MIKREATDLELITDHDQAATGSSAKRFRRKKFAFAHLFGDVVTIFAPQMTKFKI